MEIEARKRFDIDIKRLYLPVTVNVECHKCKTLIEDSYEDNYLSYPSVGVEEERVVYCDNCDLELSYSVKLKVSLETDGVIKEVN